MHFKPTGHRALLACCLASVATPALAQERAPDQDDSILNDTIIVTASRSDASSDDRLAPPEQIALPADAASIAARAPGGALVGNGALSGQLSYRGLAGQRVLGRVNGQRFASGGPNAMDPPLHYAPSVLVDRLEIARGVAPVSEGPSLAGAVNAQLVETGFSSGDALEPQMRVAAQYRSVDDSYAVGGLAGLANEHWRLGVIAAREEGNDYEYPEGTVLGTGFKRDLYGIHAGFQTGPGEIFAEYRRSETDPTGTPPFALDLVFFDTDFVRGGFRGEIGNNVHLDLQLGHVAVRHRMDNQTIRQPAASTMRARATNAEADTNTAEAKLRFGTVRKHFELGADIENIDKFVTITNPFSESFFIGAQPNVRSERWGAFAQWRGSMSAIEFELGGRVDHTRQDAGVPQVGPAVPMAPQMLAAGFASSDRSRSATTVDAVLRAWAPIGDFVPRVALARKERVPSLLERFGWLPTEASFGLADGNIYVGNLELAPETAWIAELGFDLEGDAYSLRPTLFYRRVDDYIQGVPVDATVGVVDSPIEMIAAMNGDPTPLRFDNVDAELWGADADFMVRPLSHLELSGTASYVRGKRRDIDDNLYRVAPANLRLSAAWLGDRFSAGAEVIAAFGQDEVALFNEETTSEGYAVVGLFARYEVATNIALEAGMENLFDELYAPHLAGRNRSAASDVPVGDRLPGAGRGGWIRFNAVF